MLGIVLFLCVAQTWKENNRKLASEPPYQISPERNRELIQHSNDFWIVTNALACDRDFKIGVSCGAILAKVGNCSNYNDLLLRATEMRHMTVEEMEAKYPLPK